MKTCVCAGASLLSSPLRCLQVPIFSLPQEWLWCESWCSDASKAEAKTIDLCNNPQARNTFFRTLFRACVWPSLLALAGLLRAPPPPCFVVASVDRSVRLRFYVGSLQSVSQECRSTTDTLAEGEIPFSHASKERMQHT